MKKFIVTIEKEAVFDEVALNSAYAGAKSEPVNGLFDRVATVKADETLLSKFWKEMSGLIADKFREFISATENTDDVFSISMELSNAYDETLSPSVADDIRGAMAAGITAKWFDFSFPDKSKDWLQQAESLLSSAMAKICHRKRPRRQ